MYVCLDGWMFGCLYGASVEGHVRMYEYVYGWVDGATVESVTFHA